MTLYLFIQHSAIGSELPKNVYLMTYETWAGDAFLIRFEHILETNEDPELSKPATLNLSNVFPGNYQFAEVNLAANQWIDDVSRLKFQKERADLLRPIDKTKVGERTLASLEITLNPMQIRTFIMSPKRHSQSETLKKLLPFESSRLSYIHFLPLALILMLFIWKFGKKCRLWRICIAGSSSSVPHEKLKPLSFAE